MTRLPAPVADFEPEIAGSGRFVSRQDQSQPAIRRYRIQFQATGGCRVIAAQLFFVGRRSEPAGQFRNDARYEFSVMNFCHACARPGDEPDRGIRAGHVQTSLSFAQSVQNVCDLLTQIDLDHDVSECIS